MALGRKTGGREAGTPNRLTIERRMRARSGLAVAELTGALPLDILLAAMRGGAEAATITDRQLQAAIAAAPYLHPKLAAVAVRQDPPPDPDRAARAAAIRAKLHAMMQAFAVPEPLVIEGRAEEH
jgi:hypothetical protein